MNFYLSELKEIISSFAVIVTIYAFSSYIKDILKNRTKPHIFTWIIWSISTSIIFLAQLSEGAGVGSYAIGVSAIIAIIIVILTYKQKSDFYITKSDCFFFSSTIIAIPIWYLCKNPLYSVIILTAINTIAMFPTIRKSYLFPYSEQIDYYLIMIVRNILVILALESYSLTTILFPAVVSTSCFILVSMLIYRRKIIKL